MPGLAHTKHHHRRQPQVETGTETGQVMKFIALIVRQAVNSKAAGRQIHSHQPDQQCQPAKASMSKDRQGQQRVGKPLVQTEGHAPGPIQQHLQGRHVAVATHQRAIEEQCEQVQEQAETQVENGQEIYFLGNRGL